MAKLSKKTIKELERLGLDTDWPSEDIAKFHIKNAQRQEEAERQRRQMHREEVEAADHWPQEIHDGVEIVEVASGREVILQDLNLRKFTYGLYVKAKRGDPWNKPTDDEGGVLQGSSIAMFLRDIKEGYKIVRGYTPERLQGDKPDLGSKDAKFAEQYQYWKKFYE